MISQAYILGNIGQAVFQREGQWFLMDANDKIRAWHPLDRNSFALITPEIRHLEGEQRLPDLKKLLKAETKKQEALTLALQLMDESITEATLKADIADLLEAYLSSKSVLEFVENRLFSTIVPATFHPEQALQICQAQHAKKAASLYTQLNVAAESIASFYTLWQKGGMSYFSSLADFDAAYALLTDRGVAKQFTLSLANKERLAWDKAVIQATKLLQQQHLLHDAKLFADMGGELEAFFGVVFKESAPVAEEISEPQDPIVLMIEEYMEQYHKARTTKRSRKDREKLIRKKGGGEGFGRVKDQVIQTDTKVLQAKVRNYSDNIVDSILSNRPGRIDEYLTHLLKLQFKYSDPRHICMSLCNIAHAVLEIGATSISWRFLAYAKLLNPQDVVVYTQTAELLKAEGNIAEAKMEYLRIKQQFPNDAVAQKGYAEILKAEGNLADAKAEYLRIRQHFPNDVVAQNGYAEILKAEGNLAEAKAAYLGIKQQFPNDVFAQTGYAEILKAEGNLAEAKAAYLGIKQQFPNDVVAQTGYAEILKAGGNLFEAKTEYLRINQQFKGNAVAQKGYAEILKAEGNLSEAKVEYLRINQQFPNNVIAQTGYAEILKTEGNLSEAKAEYLRIKQQFPNDVVAQNGYAEILKTEGNLAEAKMEYEHILSKHPFNQYALHALNNIALTLNQPLPENLPFPKKPQSENDYYWHHLHIKNLIKSGDWDQAQALTQAGLANCPFYQHRIVYKKTLKYLKLQTKEFKALLEDLNNDENTPLDQVFRTHIYAATDHVEEAKAALKESLRFQQIKVIYEVSCLLSERFNINGLPKTGLPHPVLDERIREREFAALLTLL